MKKIIAYAVFLLLIVSFAAADLCKESDDGKDYAEQGYVKYGVIQYDDLCVLSLDTDMRVEEGLYLKEYYCDKDTDERKHKIINCADEGFDKCKNGQCVGDSSSDSSDSSQTTTPVYTGPECGNKKIEAGEDCDPPTKICYVGSDIGLCSAACKCEIKISSGTSDSTDSESEIVDEESEETTDTGPEDEEKPIETKQKTTAEDKDGVSTQKDRLALPKEPKRGLVGRIWHWFWGMFD
ncbi:hypothetical protein JW851_02955 [Candidatus Woesearchaeota archaeon]|nr:hypothetical protein [Candidatus Woesearchaeota archaeon]